MPKSKHSKEIAIEKTITCTFKNSFQHFLEYTFVKTLFARAEEHLRPPPLWTFQGGMHIFWPKTFFSQVLRRRMTTCEDISTARSTGGMLPPISCWLKSAKSFWETWSIPSAHMKKNELHFGLKEERRSLCGRWWEFQLLSLNNHLLKKAWTKAHWKRKRFPNS